MAGPADISDVEYAAKQWAKAHPYLSPLVAGRVWFALPPGDVPMPCLVVSLLTESVDMGPAVQGTRLTWDCWSDATAADPTMRGKAGAVRLKNALVAALREAPASMLMPGVECVSIGDDLFVNWQPDQEANAARYVVDVTVGTRAVALA